MNICIDLDGTLYLGTQPIDGAVNAVENLKKIGHKITFASNTISSMPEEIIQNLNNMGFQADITKLITPISVAKNYFKKSGLKKIFFIIREQMKEKLRMYFEIEEEYPQAIVIADEPGAVPFKSIEKAFRLLLHRKVKFFTFAMNRFYKLPDGEMRMDLGPQVAQLSYATGKEPVNLGKPSEIFFKYAVGDFEEAVMIGDDVEFDIKGAMDLNIKGILVKTGKYNDDFFNNSGIAPTKIINSIADLPEIIELIKKK